MDGETEVSKTIAIVKPGARTQVGLHHTIQPLGVSPHPMYPKGYGATVRLETLLTRVSL